ncbi:MAG: hypothetical protein SW019_22670 [Actinomycetota bacterium]|nr:hypothetical protein [Actinomycetota bacterium]
MAAVNRARTTTSAVGRRARFAWRTAAVLGAALAVVACQQAPQDDSEPTSALGLEVRHDTEPLVEMFPPLGDPVSASWIMWDNSEVAEGSRVDVTWIDAVVEVSPETMDGLVADNVTEDRDQHPAVQRVLEPELPPGPFLTGVDLNIVFGGAGQSTRVFLDDQHDTVVLQSYSMTPR